jgi:hypothetical protein
MRYKGKDLRKLRRRNRLQAANERLRHYYDHLITLTPNPEHFLQRALQEYAQRSATAKGE